MTRVNLENGLTAALAYAGIEHQHLDKWLESTFVKIRDRGRVTLALLKTNELFPLLQEMVGKINTHFLGYVGLELAPDSLDPDGLIVHILTKQQLAQIQESQQNFDIWWLVNNYRASWHLGMTVHFV